MVTKRTLAQYVVQFISWIIGAFIVLGVIQFFPQIFNSRQLKQQRVACLKAKNGLDKINQCMNTFLENIALKKVQVSEKCSEHLYCFRQICFNNHNSLDHNLPKKYHSMCRRYYIMAYNQHNLSKILFTQSPKK